MQRLYHENMVQYKKKYKNFTHGYVQKGEVR